MKLASIAEVQPDFAPTPALGIVYHAFRILKAREQSLYLFFLHQKYRFYFFEGILS